MNSQCATSAPPLPPIEIFSKNQGNLPRRCIILDEDPQRVVDPVETLDFRNGAESEDSAELGAVGDGIGEEDNDDEGIGDEVHDEQDPVTNVDSAEGKSRQRRSLPTWLAEVFKVRVAEATNRDAHGRRDGIPCPHCQHRLYRHSPISRPRRCIDFDSTFWMIGFRYRCLNCLHPKSQKKTVTFRSWDSRILAAMPQDIAEEFPARLSHRSAISKPLFHWLRSCFRNGMGAKQFSDALRVQHLLRYDMIQLQYLRYLSSRKSNGSLAGRIYQTFLPFGDTSPNGPCGFVPSATWLRDVYDNYIESKSHHINQHTSMLPANICAIDHSHKV